METLHIDGEYIMAAFTTHKTKLVEYVTEYFVVSRGKTAICEFEFDIDDEIIIRDSIPIKYLDEVVKAIKEKYAEENEP